MFCCWVFVYRPPKPLPPPGLSHTHTFSSENPKGAMNAPSLPTHPLTVHNLPNPPTNQPTKPTKTQPSPLPPSSDPFPDPSRHTYSLRSRSFYSYFAPHLLAKTNNHTPPGKKKKKQVCPFLKLLKLLIVQAKLPGVMRNVSGVFDPG